MFTKLKLWLEYKTILRKIEKAKIQGYMNLDYQKMFPVTAEKLELNGYKVEKQDSLFNILADIPIYTITFYGNEVCNG